jgi:hypothetical protein
VVDESVDSLGCRDYLVGLADLLEGTLRTSSGRYAYGIPSAFYLVGTGALGVALDAVVAVLSPLIDIPIVRVNSHRETKFTSDALVIGASFAGDTPETTEHLERALDEGVSVEVVAAFGPLCDLVVSCGGTTLSLDRNAPGPRWAMLQCFVATLASLSDLLPSEVARPLLEVIQRSIDTFRSRASSQTSWDSAAVLARRIDRTMVLTIGSGDLASVAAHRLASQIEENAKTFAVSFQYPEFGYSTVAGFGQCGDLTRQVFTAVELCDNSEVAADARRRAVVADILDEQVATRITLTGEGESPLEQFFDLVAQGDQLSLCLASHVGIDPGPVPTIVEVKQAAANR